MNIINNLQRHYQADDFINASILGYQSDFKDTRSSMFEFTFELIKQLMR